MVPSHTPAEPQIVAPRQARSRATMERIVAATEELLAEKPFEQITIAEICARSGSAPTALYARFSDKTALLLELHDRFDRMTANTIEDSLTGLPRERSHRSSLVETAATRLIALHLGHRRLLRSVLLADNPTLRGRVTRQMQSVSKAITTTLTSDLAGAERSAAERDIDFAVRTSVALLQQALLFDAEGPTLFDYSDSELTERIVELLLTSCATYL